MNSPNASDINVNLPQKAAIDNQFAAIARLLGIISLFCVFLNIFYGALIFGGLAIILAVLSKGNSSSMSGPAVAGLITGSISVAVEIILLIAVCIILYTPEFRQQFNTLYEQSYQQLYGQPANEALEDIFNNTEIPRVEGGDL
ncbi:MAG: hypothetical protein ACI4D2_03475 [Lachnospiraceae bacterium]